jgi:hypothetical protein
MTSEMKSFLLSQIQDAIDEAVADSGRISDIVQEMKRGGYDVCLMLESTIAISPNDDVQPDVASKASLESEGDLELTADDIEFLEELNISA